MNPPARPFAAVLTLLLVSLCGVPAAGFAQSAGQPYRFEMIVFERPYDSGDESWPASPGVPEQARSSGPLVSTVPRSARVLGPVAYTLGRQGMTVHGHVIWQEVPGPRNGKNWRWLDAGRVQGLIRMSRGRFLHLDTDLILRTPGSATPYRVRLNRRMRSNELHYVDHPKLGILIQAQRVVESASPSAVEEGDGEPRPAAPDDGSG